MEFYHIEPLWGKWGPVLSFITRRLGVPSHPELSLSLLAAAGAGSQLACPPVSSLRNPYVSCFPLSACPLGPGLLLAQGCWAVWGWHRYLFLAKGNADKQIKNKGTSRLLFPGLF